MAADQRRSCSGEDHISGLPDELLHDILVRLRCARAAARTSVLSRRWRQVWAHLPELLLKQPERPAMMTSGSGTSFLDTVDAGLAGYSSPTLERLSISLAFNGNDLFRAGRIAPWLRFAAESAVGELSLDVPHQWFSYQESEEELLELPACARAKRIELSLRFAPRLRLTIQACGLFAALTSLKINGDVHMEGSDLTALVCTQCPCLQDLSLHLHLIAESDVSVHSNSLHTLRLGVYEIRRLEVVASRLEALTVATKPKEAHISAPKLVKVSWQHEYDPQVHHFVDVGRTLRLLETSTWASSLTKRFDEIDELRLEVNLTFEGGAMYQSFLNETSKLPKCKSFSIALHRKDYALVPIMLHLWGSCNGTKKFLVYVSDAAFPPGMPPPYPWSCLCRFEKNRKIDGIDLSSLEEVEMKGFSHSHEQMKLLELLSSYNNAGILKRLVIISAWFSPTPKEVRERICSMCHPNVEVEFGEEKKSFWTRNRSNIGNKS